MNEYVRAVAAELGKKLKSVCETETHKASVGNFFAALQKEIDQARRLCEAMEKAGGGR